MDEFSKTLQLNDVGAFGELAGRPNPNRYAILSVPPFETMLPFLAKRLGRELTPAEIEVERNKAPCIVVTADAAAQMAVARASRNGAA